MDIAGLMMRNRRLMGIMLGVFALLMVPALASIFTSEVRWGPEDYIASAILLGGTGLLAELVLRRQRNRVYNVAAAIGLFAMLALIWINLAVGLIGSENNRANLLYIGVLVIAFAGVALSRFQPIQMSRALLLTAAAQAAVPFIALVIWRPSFSGGMVGVLILNFVFVMLFATSGFLFKRSANTPFHWDSTRT